MAMQTGLWFSKMLSFGADLLGKLQSLVKELGKSKEQSNGDSDRFDVVAAATQVRCLAMEIWKLGYNRQITVRTENSRHSGNMTSLIIPAATLGALGCGYMWWVADTCGGMYIHTKKELIYDGIEEGTKSPLKQRIKNLEDRMLQQNELSRLIKKDVARVQKSLFDLQNMVSDLDEEISSLEYQQELANVDILSLCNLVDRKKGEMPEASKLYVTGIEVQEESEVKECADGCKRRISQNRKAEMCMICLEELQVGSCATLVPCSHQFHTMCITMWLRANHHCPLCRFEFPRVKLKQNIRS